MGEYINVIIIACLGTGGIVGVFFYFLRRSIEKRLIKAEKEAEERKEISLKRATINDELCHAYGRMFFWIYKFIITGNHNGDLDKAMEALEAAEAKKKDLDRSIIVDSERGV